MEKIQAITLIKELSNANGVSGFEQEVVRTVQKHTQKLGTQKTDEMKNLYIERLKNTGQQPLIQFDAHSDEVGFIVQAVKPNGLLKFLPLDGWVPNNIAAQKVRVKNKHGQYINGIITSKPPHFMRENERQQLLTIDDLSIDVGARSQKELEEVYQIGLGAPVVPAVECEFNETTGLFLGKAFDCRIGCACMIDVLEELQAADLSIVFEGCPADDTSADNYMIQSALGKDPMLRYFDVSMITSPEFQQYTIDLAQEKGIPIQLSVRSGGGTNGSAINEVQGAPAIVVGIPGRYAHTHHCYVDFHDYQADKKLVIELVKSLDRTKIAALLETI